MRGIGCYNEWTMQCIPFQTNTRPDRSVGLSRRLPAPQASRRGPSDYLRTPSTPVPGLYPYQTCRTIPIQGLPAPQASIQATVSTRIALTLPSRLLSGRSEEGKGIEFRYKTVTNIGVILGLRITQLWAPHTRGVGRYGLSSGTVGTLSSYIFDISSARLAIESSHRCYGVSNDRSVGNRTLCIAIERSE
jgi:hypothetical protein